jgi:phosphotransferase family enzyme
VSTVQKTGRPVVFRVLNFTTGGKEVLLTAVGARYRLPRLTVRAGERVAAAISERMRTEWREEVLCLFSAESNDPQNPDYRYMVTEQHRSLDAPPETAVWIPLSALCPEFFLEVGEYTMIELGRASLNSPSGPFARLGWLSELRQWAASVREPHRLELRSFRQLNASPSFSLVRFETNGTPVWLKAVGPPNQREFSITCLLARIVPQKVPILLAVRPDWRAWISEEVDGLSLDQSRSFHAWRAAAIALSQLQIECIPFGQEIAAAGALDLSNAKLFASVGPFFAVMRQLMAQQRTIPPPILGSKELASLEERVKSAVLEIGQLDLPDTIGHLDLNPGNIFLARNGCVFLDWAEGCSGQPFHSMEYLMQHFRRTDLATREGEIALRSAYLDGWRKVLPETKLNRAMPLISLLAVFAYAVASEIWTKPEGFGNPTLAGYFRALVRRMYAESERLAQPEVRC